MEPLYDNNTSQSGSSSSSEIRDKDSNDQDVCDKCGNEDPNCESCGYIERPSCDMMNKNPKYRYRPKPLGRKNSRNFVPDEQKTEDYWEKRMKNNLAARKSREDRRKKELETIERKKSLERENFQLRLFIQKLESENQYLLYQRELLRENRM